MLVREAKTQERLVVAPLHVEARAVLLDQLVLEEQRLFLARDDDGLQRAEQAIEQGDEGPRVGGAGVEIAAHPVREVDRLADVDDPAGLVLHQVHAGLIRQLREALFELDRSHQFLSLSGLAQTRNER